MGHVHICFVLQLRQGACEHVHTLTCTTAAEWKIMRSESGGEMSRCKTGTQSCCVYRDCILKMFNVGSKEDNL